MCQFSLMLMFSLRRLPPDLGTPRATGGIFILTPYTIYSTYGRSHVFEECACVCARRSVSRAPNRARRRTRTCTHYCAGERVRRRACTGKLLSGRRRPADYNAGELRGTELFLKTGCQNGYA
eukprot:COSAG02_NODE_483_length_21396_cov_20.544801_3_plen_122_part_00